MMYMVILVMYDHFHGIKSLFCPMEHKFPAVNKKCPQNLLSKPVPLYAYQIRTNGRLPGRLYLDNRVKSIIIMSPSHACINRANQSPQSQLSCVSKPPQWLANSVRIGTRASAGATYVCMFSKADTETTWKTKLATVQARRHA